VEKRLRIKIEQRVGAARGGDLTKGQLGLKRAFRLFQPDPETNRISMDSFRQLLVSMGFTVKDALGLFSKYDRNGDQHLDIHEFSHAIMGKDSFDCTIPLRKKPISVYPKNLREHLRPDTLNERDRILAVKEVARDQMNQFATLELHDAEQRLREKVLQRIGNAANKAVGQLGLKRAFLIFDPQDEGVITPQNFIKILENLGFAKRDAALIFQKYDQNGSGRIELSSFQRLLMMPARAQFSTMAMAEARQKAAAKHTHDALRWQGATNSPVHHRLPVEEVEARLKAKLEHRIGNLFNRSSGQLGEDRAFSLFNPVEGNILLPDFCKVLESFGFVREDAVALFKKADVNQSGGLDICEFRELLFGQRNTIQSRPSSCGLPVRHPSPSNKQAWGPELARPASRDRLHLERPSSQAGVRPSQRRPNITWRRSRAQSATPYSGKLSPSENE